MKYKTLKELKQDKNISPEDVARFALYENDLNDSGKFTGICDLVVACENSQTAPLKQLIKQLEARNKELEERLKIVDNPNWRPAAKYIIKDDEPQSDRYNETF